MESEWVQWQRKQYFNIVLIHQGQCLHSERFLRVHLSHRMCNQYTHHHKFRIHTRRTFWAKDRRYCSRLWILWTRNRKIRMTLTWSTASCVEKAENVEETSKHGVLGRHQTCSKMEDLSSIKHDRTQSSFTTQSQLIVSRRLSWWLLEKTFTRKYMSHFDCLRRFPLTTIGWNN